MEGRSLQNPNPLSDTFRRRPYAIRSFQDLLSSLLGIIPILILIISTIILRSGTN